MTDAPPRQLVVDTGPVIAVMYEEDAYHERAARGFRALSAARTEIILPVPILFEVYKRLTYDVGPDLGRRGLDSMRESFTLLYLDEEHLDLLQSTVAAMPWWGGSLEDALVAIIGLADDLSVWTFNYRDLYAFPDLQFWTPA